MREVIKVNLDNEMDLIMAHRRSMKLAEMCGLTLSSQTSFATAVSEIARCSISQGDKSYMILGIDLLRGGKKQIAACIFDKIDIADCNPEAIKYCKNLAGDIQFEKDEDFYKIIINHKVPYPGILSETRVEEFINYFKIEPPLSPYDEIRKKNIQLIALTEKLSESESKYRQVTDNLPLLVFSIDSRNNINLTNKWIRENIHVPFQTFSHAMLESIVHPEDIENVWQHWLKAKNKAAAFKSEARINLSGDYLWHIISIMPKRNELGDVTEWIGSFVDVNAQKLIAETLKDNDDLKIAQEKLEKTNLDLSRKNLELEQFAYVASHDLQEPLRKIKFLLSMAERKLSDEQIEQFQFTKVKHSADRMSTLVKDILNFSMLSSETEEIFDVDLNAVSENIISDYEYSILEKNAVINISTLPVVKGIPLQIHQLFYNLIGNSLKFNQNVPHITITHSIVENFSEELIDLILGKPYHQILFKDNGIGIDKQYYSKIFSIFQRLHGQNEYAGTGIGLALCKKIVENHHGAIDFTSTIDEGTTFIVYLPVN